MKFLIEAIGKHKPLVVFTLIITVFEAFLVVIPVQILGIGVDVFTQLINFTGEFSFKGRTFVEKVFSFYLARINGALGCALFVGISYFGVSGIYNLAGVGRGYVTTLLGEKVITSLRLRFFGHLLRSRLSYLNEHNAGDFVSRAMNDIGGARQIIISPINGLLSDIFSMLWAGYFSIRISPVLGLIMLIPSPLMIYLGFYFGRRQKEISLRGREELAGLNTNIINRLKGILLIKSSGSEIREEEGFGKRLDSFLRINIKGLNVTSWLLTLVNIIKIFMVGVIIVLGGMKVVKSELSIGEFTVLTQYLLRFYLPLLSISRFYDSIANAMAGIKRVGEVLERDDMLENIEVKGAEIKKGKPDGDFKNNEFNGVNLKSGRIEFDKVKFSYNEQRVVFDDLSVKIGSNEKIAILGASGNGKSSFLFLLMRLYDIQGGRILLDDIPIERYPISSLRRNFGILTQESLVFETSLADNLRYSKMDAADEELINVLDKVNLKYLLGKKGLNDWFGDMGNLLSLGERQRICIARLLLMKPKVILLDEPTAHLDPENERSILSIIKELFADKTMIITSHRAPVIDIVNRVFVIKNKRMEEISKKEALGLGFK